MWGRIQKADGETVTNRWNQESSKASQERPPLRKSRHDCWAEYNRAIRNELSAIIACAQADAMMQLLLQQVR